VGPGAGRETRVSTGAGGAVLASSRSQASLAPGGGTRFGSEGAIDSSYAAAHAHVRGGDLTAIADSTILTSSTTATAWAGRA
jgi:hypothetical protein